MLLWGHSKGPISDTLVRCGGLWGPLRLCFSSSVIYIIERCDDTRLLNILKCLEDIIYCAYMLAKKNIHPIIKKKHMFVLYIFEIIFSAKNFSNLISEKYMNCGSAALILLNKFLFFWTKFTFKLITETECTANVMWCVTWSFKAVC